MQGEDVVPSEAGGVWGGGALLALFGDGSGTCEFCSRKRWKLRGQEEVPV